jgi:tetratricopeptide (TPR) repeat protein
MLNFDFPGNYRERHKQMTERARQKACNQALVAFLAALSVMVAFGVPGIAFAESSDKDSPSAADEFNAVSKEIQQSVKALGYTDDADIDLVQIVGGWKYMDWKHALGQAKQDFQQKKISAEQLAQVEEDTLKELGKAIQKDFAPASSESEYFYLSKAVKNKTTQYLGYCQLFYILGNTIGLNVKVVDVLEPDAGALPAGEEHAACLVDLAGSKAAIVDLTQENAGKSFVLREQYNVVGNFWELKPKDNPFKIPRRIQVLDKNGLIAEIYNSMGNAYAKSGKDAEALTFFTKAIELNPKLAKAYSSRGAEFFNKSEPKKAIADLDKAIDLDPKDAEAYNNLGTMLSALGQDAKALADFNKALEIKPNFSGALKNRGRIYSKLGKNPEALADLNKALELSPKDADIYLRLGIMYDQSGKNDKAISSLTKAIEINPKFAEAYCQRGAIYGKLGKYTDAISDFIKAVDINPKYAEAYYNRGLVYSQLDQTEQAITYFTKAIELNSKFTPAYVNRGISYSKSGHLTEARSDFTKVIQLNPKFALAYLNRGIVNAGLKRNEDAKRDLQKAAELDPALADPAKKILDKLK